MAFVAGNFVAGSTFASWTPLRKSSTPNITTWYHAESGTMINYDSIRDIGVKQLPGSSGRIQVEKDFAPLIAAANQRLKTPTTPTGTSPISVPAAGGSSSSGGSNKPRNFKTKYAIYPEDMGTTKMDRIMFEMRKAGTRIGQFSGSSSSGLTGFGPLPTGESLGSVFLGIQGPISDSNSVDWSGATMNPLQAALAESAIKAMSDPTNDVGEMLSKLGGKVLEKAKKAIGSGDSRSNLQILLAQEAVQSQGLLSRLKGQVANPNLELLFNGPQLRTFSFNFRMVSRSTTEAANVKKIIRFFKEGMAVQTTDTDIFLKSPNVFDIQYQSGESGSRHRSLPKINTSALIRCDVNYVPDGSYMTFADEAQGFPMTCYDLSLGFSEIAPLTAEDYDNSDDIGF